MNTDPIADLLTRIRNAGIAGHPTTLVPASTVKERILKVLQEQGYIESFEQVTAESDKPALKIFLRYRERGECVIKELKRLSTPGRRWYVKKDEVPQMRGGLGTILVSTSQGVVTDQEARKRGVGGELICSVF